MSEELEPTVNFEENVLIDNILRKSDSIEIVREYDLILDDLNIVAVTKGPGVFYELYARNEKISERLKILNYEKHFVSLSSAFKVLPRHYFVKSTNVGEQFFIFTSLAVWLIKTSKLDEKMEMPHEFDDPNTILTNIQIDVSFTTTKLKSGSGPQCIFVLDKLTALTVAEKHIKFCKIEVAEMLENDNDNIEFGESLGDGNLEITAEQFDDDEDEIVAAADDEDIGDDLTNEASLNLIDNTASNSVFESFKLENDASKQQNRLKPIIHSFIEPSSMNTELQRVIPQLKITIRSDAKDWKMHSEKIERYENTINAQFNNIVRPFLTQNARDIGEAIERITSREEHMNNQFDHLMHNYCLRQNEFAAVSEKYRESSGTLNSRAETLSNLNAEIDQIKQQIEEQGIKNTNGTPILKIKQSLAKLEKSIFTMRIQVVAAEQTLIQSQFTDRLNIVGNNELFR